MTDNEQLHFVSYQELKVFPFVLILNLTLLT